MEQEAEQEAEEREEEEKDSLLDFNEKVVDVCDPSEVLVSGNDSQEESKEQQINRSIVSSLHPKSEYFGKSSEEEILGLRGGNFGSDAFQLAEEGRSLVEG